MRTATFALLALVVVALLMVGCHRHDSKTRLTTSSTMWTWDADLHHETDEDTYFWTTVLTQAGVEVLLRDYVGEARIRVFDADGALIFDQEYENHHSRDDDFHVASTLTGTPGEWRIRIDLDHYDGKLDLTLFE